MLNRAIRCNLIISLILLLPVLLIIPLITVLGQQEWLTYENEDLGFSVQYPPDWVIEEEEDRVRLVNNDGTLNVEIMGETLSDEELTLEEYSDMRISDLEENTENFDLFQSTSTTLGAGDYPAHKIIYKLTAERTGEPNTVTRFWTIQDDKAYSMAYIGAEPKYFNSYSIALKMFDSFQITGN